eukprot:4309313-Amphidinium_carterae.1
MAVLTLCPQAVENVKHIALLTQNCPPLWYVWSLRVNCKGFFQKAGPFPTISYFVLGCPSVHFLGRQRGEKGSDNKTCAAVAFAAL